MLKWNLRLSLAIRLTSAKIVVKVEAELGKNHASKATLAKVLKLNAYCVHCLHNIAGIHYICLPLLVLTNILEYCVGESINIKFQLNSTVLKPKKFFPALKFRLKQKQDLPRTRKA